jgi:hypothetical protein
VQGSKLGLQDEVVHDAVLLMDRAVSASKEVPNALLPLVSTAALGISARQGDAEGCPPTAEDLQATAGAATQPGCASDRNCSCTRYLSYNAAIAAP